MARPEKIELEVPVAAGVGRAANVFRFRDKTVQVAGVFEGSLEFEGSIGGDDYAVIGAALTGPALVAVPLTVEFVRVRVMTLASGTPRAVLAGFDYRAV